ncbi:MAG: type II toxin-antitoxin system HicB family antitoxin [Gammaproteobacteria bacterium]|jgi:antitoxin HicB
MKQSDYPFIVRTLSKDEGGGILIEYPDLPGCISDGETIEEAIANGKDAVKCWIKAAKKSGRAIPKPSKKLPSGKWVQRVPKSLHAKLIEQAKQEGVSLNTLVVSLIAISLGLHGKNKEASSR